MRTILPAQTHIILQTYAKASKQTRSLHIGPMECLQILDQPRKNANAKHVRPMLPALPVAVLALCATFYCVKQNVDQGTWRFVRVAYNIER